MEFKSKPEIRVRNQSLSQSRADENKVQRLLGWINSMAFYIHEYVNLSLFGIRYNSMRKMGKRKWQKCRFDVIDHRRIIEIEIEIDFHVVSKFITLVDHSQMLINTFSILLWFKKTSSALIILRINFINNSVLFVLCAFEWVELEIPKGNWKCWTSERTERHGKKLAR